VSGQEQLTKVFASFFKKKCFFLFFLKKEPKTLIYLAFTPERSARLDLDRRLPLI